MSSPIDSGKWNTAFEGYASSCLTYARTAFPADHSSKLFAVGLFWAAWI